METGRNAARSVVAVEFQRAGAAVKIENADGVAAGVDDQKRVVDDLDGALGIKIAARVAAGVDIGAAERAGRVSDLLAEFAVVFALDRDDRVGALAVQNWCKESRRRLPSMRRPARTKRLKLTARGFVWIDSLSSPFVDLTNESVDYTTNRRIGGAADWRRFRIGKWSPQQKPRKAPKKSLPKPPNRAARPRRRRASFRLPPISLRPAISRRPSPACWPESKKE